MTDMDPLLERIDQDLAECDATTMSVREVVPVSDEMWSCMRDRIAELADLELTPLQHDTVSALWPPTGTRPGAALMFVTSTPGGVADGEVLLEMRARAERSPRGFSPDVVILDELFAPPAPEATEVALAEVVRKAYELEDAPKPPEKIKLTSGEWETAEARMPVPSDWGPNRPADWIWGVPVELVDDPEESDLRQRFRRERLGFRAGESEVR